MLKKINLKFISIDTFSQINYDDNLARVLDRLILYLRVVHSVDYYACRIYPEEDDEPRRISTFTLRDDPIRMSTPKRLAHYIRA